jgi:hypothetical protein
MKCVRHEVCSYVVVTCTALVLAGVVACGATTPLQQEHGVKDTMEFNFEIDRDGTFEPDEAWLRHNNPRLSTNGTPEITSGVGIAINVPREVSFSEAPRLIATDAQFIVCVATQFVYNTMGFGSRFMDKVTSVIVDARTHREYAAPTLLTERNNFDEHRIPMPEVMRDPKNVQTNTTIGEYLRVNMAAVIDLPAVETEYIVYASMGPYRSNTLTVKVVRRKASPTSKSATEP